VFHGGKAAPISMESRFPRGRFFKILHHAGKPLGSSTTFSINSGVILNHFELDFPRDGALLLEDETLSATSFTTNTLFPTVTSMIVFLLSVWLHIASFLLFV